LLSVSPIILEVQEEEEQMDRWPELKTFGHPVQTDSHTHTHTHTRTHKQTQQWIKDKPWQETACKL